LKKHHKTFILIGIALSLFCSEIEQEYIKKFRKLDEHGGRIVSAVLDLKYARVAEAGC